MYSIHNGLFLLYWHTITFVFSQIFDDIMTVKKGQKSSMVLDMNQCNAYSSLGYFTSSSSSLLLQTSSILLILFSMLLIWIKPIIIFLFMFFFFIFCGWKLNFWSTIFKILVLYKSHLLFYYLCRWSHPRNKFTYYKLTLCIFDECIR